MTHDEMIAVIQAHKDGKQIEWQSVTAEWLPFAFQDLPAFNFVNTRYRIKPHLPRKAREWWIHCQDLGNAVVYMSGMYSCPQSQINEGEHEIHVREVLP